MRARGGNPSAERKGNHERNGSYGRICRPGRAAWRKPAVSFTWLVIDFAVLETRERRNEEFFHASDNPQQMLERFLARSLWHNQLIESQAEANGGHILKQGGTRTVNELCDCVLSRFADR